MQQPLPTFDSTDGDSGGQVTPFEHPFVSDPFEVSMGRTDAALECNWFGFGTNGRRIDPQSIDYAIDNVESSDSKAAAPLSDTERTDQMDSAWNTDWLEYQFRSDTSDTNETPATNGALFRSSLAAKPMSLSALQLSSLDEACAPIEGSQGNQGHSNLPAETEKEASWPFDTTSRMVVQGVSKPTLGAHSAYTTVATSNRDIFYATFDPSATFGSVDTEEWETPAPAGASVTVTSSLTLDSDDATVTTPPCQRAKTLGVLTMAHARQSSGVHSDSNSHAHAQTPDTLNDSSEMREQVARLDSMGLCDPKDTAVVVVSDISSSLRDPISTRESCVLQRTEPAPNDSVTNKPLRRDTRDRSSPRIPVPDFDKLTPRDFERVENRQFLHQLVYKHKMGVSLDGLKGVQSDNAK